MYQVGNNQGQSYSGKEGEGFATILSLPKTDNIQVWKYENDNKRKQALIDQQRQENQKAMGILANVVPDGFYKHDKDLNDWMAKHVDSASRVIGNPYDLRTAEGAERVKDLNALKGAIAASKNFRDQYNKYQDMKKGDYSPESIAVAEKYFTQGADLKALTNGNLTPFSLQPKNPIDTEMAALLPVQQLDATYKKGGKDLIDDPDTAYTVLNDALKQPQTAAFYENKIASMSPQQQAELNTNALKATNEQKRLVTPQMYLAQQFLPSVIPATAYDENKTVGDIAKNIGDDEIKMENGTVTVKRVNQGAAFDNKVQQSAVNFLKSGSPDAVRALKKYGISESDIANNTPSGAKAVNDMADKIKLQKKKITERTEDELSKWQLDALKTDKAANNSGGEFMRQLNAAAITNNPNALVLGIASNVIDMGDNTKVNNVTPTGDGKTIKVDYEVYDREKGVFAKAPQPAILDMTNPSVRAAIQMRYAGKVNEKKGTDINSIQKGIETKGALDNRGIKKSSNDKKETPKSSKTGGMY